MKPLILICLALPLWAQLQTVNNESMPTARVKINANFTWLNSNKVGTSDSRLTDARTPLSHVHLIADITGLQTALDLRAPIASPTFTGTVSGVSKTMVGLGNVTNVVQEPALGNPNVDGKILSSTAAGVRSWITPAGGGSGTMSVYASGLIAGPDTTRAITGATHGLVSTGCPLMVSFRDNSSPNEAMAVGYTVDASTCDVAYTFAEPQSNYYVFMFGVQGIGTGSLSWASLSDGQWTGMTNGQWTGLTN